MLIPGPFPKLTAAALIGLASSCGPDSGSNSPFPGLHLLEHPAGQGSDFEPPAPWPSLLEGGTDSPFWIRGELIRRPRWKLHERRPSSFILRAEPRFPVVGAPRVAPMAQSESRRIEQDRPGAELAELPIGDVLISADGIFLHIGTASAPDRLALSYRSHPTAVLEQLTTIHASKLTPFEARTEDRSTRRCMGLPTPFRWESTVELPDHPTLDFETTVSGEAMELTQDSVRLLEQEHLRVRWSVEVRDASGNTRNVHGSTQSRTPGVRHPFEATRVDLAAWAGERVTLIFSAESLEASDPEAPSTVPIALLAEPVVRSAGPTESPNIIVVLIDTLRADRLGCYGWDRAKTPNFDRLAKLGVRYTNTMSASSWTLPSHASLFTSTYPSQHGLHGDAVLPAELTTVAEQLRDHGYRTAALTEGGYLHGRYGLHRGFEAFERIQGGVHESFPMARRWLTQAEGPYFLFLHTYQTHAPYDPPAEMTEGVVRPYDGPLELPVTPNRPGWLPQPKHGPTADDRRFLRDLYDAEVRTTDAEFGRLFDQLVESGAMENTLLIATSDHGEEFYGHGSWGHGNGLYESLLRVPLIVYWPGHFEGGLVHGHPVHGVDLAPTLARAAGVPLPEFWVGHPLGSEAPDEDARPMYVPFETYMSKDRGLEGFALRDGNLKAVAYPTEQRRKDEMPAFALFDLEADPLEASPLEGAELEAEWRSRADALLGRFSPLGTPRGVGDGQTSDEREWLEKLGYIGRDD